MVLTVDRLTPEHAPELADVLPTIWGTTTHRRWGAECMRAVVDWRYWRRPQGTTTVALENDRCVGLIDAFTRPYVVSGAQRLVRECCDWWAAPEHRAKGLGLRLMRRLMSTQEPILTVGGSAMTLSLLPRLGWQRLGEVEAVVLPLRLRYVAAAILRKHGRERLACLLPEFVPLAHLPGVSPPSARIDVTEWDLAQPIMPQPNNRCMTPLAHGTDLAWLLGVPRCLADVDCRTYWVDGEPAAFVITQLEAVVGGTEGKILHIQVADETTGLLNWVVADTVRHLARRGAGIIRARAGTVAMRAAMRRAGFRTVRIEPVYWWGSDPPSDGTPLRLSYLRADDAVPFESARG